MRWLDGITDAMDMNLGTLWEMVKDRKACRPWGQKESDITGGLNNNRQHTEGAQLVKRVNN